MNVLILGGAGFLGSNLVRRCVAENCRHITVLDSLDPLLHSTTKNLSDVWSDIRFVHGDIRDEALLAEIVADQDVIFHCAGQTSHGLSIQYPLLDAEINCLGTLKLLEAVRRFNKDAVVVYSSSSTVIGKARDEFVNENHPERPLEIYSANKGVAEKYFHIYHTRHGLKTVVLRFSNLYGPFGKGYAEFGFINYFIDRIWRNEHVKIYGKGDQTRNVMYVGDAVDILWQATHHAELYGDTFLATGSQHLTVHEIAETIVSVFQRGQVMDIEWPDDRKLIEIGHVKLSSSKLHSITGWNPSYDFQSGLQRTKAIMEQNGG